MQQIDEDEDEGAPFSTTPEPTATSGSGGVAHAVLSGSEGGGSAGGGGDPVSRLQARKTKDQAARLSKEVAELLTACAEVAPSAESGTFWEGRKASHDAHVKAGHAANDQGSARGASEAFRKAASEFPRGATLLSYVNMVAKAARIMHGVRRRITHCQRSSC